MNFNGIEGNSDIILIVLEILLCMFSFKSKLIWGTPTLLLAAEYFCVFPTQVRTHPCKLAKTCTTCNDVFNIVRDVIIYLQLHFWWSLNYKSNKPFSSHLKQYRCIRNLKFLKRLPDSSAPFADKLQIFNWNACVS